nr:hypothetical protein BaRGS_024510 [Batillaria attramentaria]
MLHDLMILSHSKKKRQAQLAKEEEQRRIQKEKQIEEDEAIARKLQSEAEEQWMQEQEEKYKRLQQQEADRLEAEKRRREEEEEATKKNGSVLLIPPDVSSQGYGPVTGEIGGAVPGAYSSGPVPEPFSSTSIPTVPDRELKKNLSISDDGPSTYPSTPPPPYTPPIPNVDRTTKPLDHFMSTGLFGGGTGALREVIVPSELMKKFIAAAESNTLRKTETMGILCGKVVS